MKIALHLRARSAAGRQTAGGLRAHRRSGARWLAQLGCAAVLLWSAGCAVDGEVIRTTVVTGDKAGVPGLREADRAMLERLKKPSPGSGPGAELGGLLSVETPHFTVGEYMQQHPASCSRAGREYAIGGGDMLRITVYEESDLSRDAVRVAADGCISFPLIGRIKVEGLTAAEAGDLISRRLAEGQFLLSAHVEVVVSEYNSKWFLVLGAVAAPGTYPLSAQERVLNAISKAGGIRETGAGKKAKIVRAETGGRQVVIDIDLQGILQGTDQQGNLGLCDRDTLFIPTAESFYIIGQVKNPGSYPLNDRELSLVEGIGVAGGFTPIASRNHTRIIRVEEGREKIIEVKVDAITRAGKNIRDVIIQPNDIIIVPESFF